MKRINHNFRKTFFLSALGISTAIGSIAQAANLVSVAKVGEWEQGMVRDVWCKSISPNFQKISSHSASELEWIKPIGSYVEKGEVIASQNAFYLKKDLKILKLDLEVAEIEHLYEQREMARISALQNKLVTQQELAIQKTKVQLSSAKVKKLKEEVEVLSYRLDKASHIAQVNGVITEVKVEPGQSISSGELLAVIQPEANKELSCELPVKVYHQVAGIKGLFSAQYQTHNNHTLSYKRGNHISDPTKQVINFILGFKELQTSPFLVGERVKVSMSVKSSNLTQVPYDALEITNDGYYVWRVNTESTVDKMAVELVYSKDAMAIVRSELNPGEQVITTGKKGLKPSDKVEVDGVQQVIASDDVNKGGVS
ncbi:MAG: hypothetical protein CMK64_12600 [Pseudoalteromonas sp.]|nr:hypothetical protein [Pseudoalteromonas sp.]|tara:strand:+ start:15683 stop:16789 length:1107 start_codon:yes stop_codon:yes gene_type:complete